MKKIILIALCLCSMTVFAAPREIIIIRHADKWTGYSGQFLSPKGQMRAEKFVSYYLKKFPQPDFIFASKPGDSKHPNESDSFRPVQTVAPLANELSFLNKKSFIVSLPYFQKQYLELSKELLNGSIRVVKWKCL
ncbi:MAG: histidine phosphatase family protein [Gammaproteobacteria bacterium]|nr:histidine phosphatase family protein [Gammaproteobacteria bacterium]